MRVLALLAPGQGSQTPGMLTPWILDTDSRQLLVTWSEAIDLDLIHLGTQADAEEIRDTANAQPLIVAAGLLSARALAADKEISFMAGHSVGEITAAAIAGVFSEVDALRLVRTRGIEMAKAAIGSQSGMSAVLGGVREDVLQAIEDAGLVAANDNGGGQIVAAGDLGALAALAPEGARVRPLQVSGAFHTDFMKPALQGFKTFAAGLEVHDAKVGLVSNKDGQVLLSGVRILDRIIEQVANPVRWDLCMSSMESSGVTRALEIAPAGTLVGLLKRGAPDVSTFALKSPDDLDSARTFARAKG
jgi:[acyl-carrier-protein] S-malonyltransferase